jgi:hypothetical protein
LEQQLGATWIDLYVAELVETEQVQAAVAADDPREDAFVSGFDELVDELGGGDVADAAALLAGRRPRPMSRWLLPVPGSPTSTTGSPASM